MYKLTNSPMIFHVNTSTYFPQSMENAEYVAYVDWLAQGNTPDPADPLPVAYADLTPRQIRMALSRVGLRDEVEAAIAASNDRDLKDWWEFSLTFERNHPEVIAMGDALGQSYLQLNALWTLGASL